MLLGLLLSVVIIAFSGGHSQETQCQSVYPSNYTFTSDHIENSNLSNCSPNMSQIHTECQHPSILTDSIIGDGEGHEDYLVWKSDTFSRLLFTFSTKIQLQAITLYYCIDRGSGTSNPQLELFTAPDDFRLGVTSPPPNSTLLIINLTAERGSYLKKSFFEPTMTRKLLVAKELVSYRLGLSEVKFYTDCENFNASGSITGRYVVNGSEITCPILAVPTTTTETLETTITTITDDEQTPSPVVYIAAAVVVVILVTATLIVIIVIITVVCWKKRRPVKEKSPTCNLKLGPLTGQVECETSTAQQPDIEDETVECTLTDGIASTLCVENKNYDIYKQPSQKATPTESHDTPNDTYAMVNKTKKKKKMDSHLNGEGDSAPPPVPEHTTEMLYTAVQKKPKKEELPIDDDDDDDDTTPPVPPFIMEDL